MGGGGLSNIPLSNPLRLLHLGANHLFDPRHPAGSCKECPESWLPFQGSCYFFSTLRATWVEAQQHCERSGAHLVIVGGLEEQVRSPGCLGAGRALSLPEGAWPGVVGGGAGRMPPAQFSPTAQGFLSRNTRGRGYWLGLRAVRKVRRIQGYQWVDGVALSFR